MSDSTVENAEIYSLTVGPLESNCFLVVSPIGRQALLIDPGSEPNRIYDWCLLHQADVKMILNTHCHGDHIGANGPLKERFGVPWGVHEKEGDFLTDPLLNLSAYFEPVTSPPADFFVQPGTFLDWEGPPVKVLHTPGHSPGSLCFLGDGWVICGDVLFRGGIGRTDFPGSDLQQLLKSIREKLLVLDPETAVYPGHGPATTIGHEIENNPFIHLG